MPTLYTRRAVASSLLRQQMVAHRADSPVSWGMAFAPSDLAQLALRRHREPWNWTFHFTALCMLCTALLLHSSLLTAAALIFFGTGFFPLNLDPPPDNRWFRFVRRAVEKEKNWAAAPWNRHKTGWFCLGLAIVSIVIWALWVREPATLALLLGFAVLARVVEENRRGGIDP